MRVVRYPLPPQQHCLVGMVGIEPTTPVLSGLYSTPELHASKIGAPYGIRTHDLRRERALS